MHSSYKKSEGEKKMSKFKTFPVPFSLDEIQTNITINTKNPSKHSKEKIISKAFNFHSQGKILKAAKYYQSLINQCFEYDFSL